MASPSRNRAAVGRFLQAAAADRAGRVDAVFLLALLKIPKCALPATALFSSDRRAIWPPLPEARACGCFRHRAGRNTNCRRRCYSVASTTSRTGFGPARRSEERRVGKEG